MFIVDGNFTHILTPLSSDGPNSGKCGMKGKTETI